MENRVILIDTSVVIDFLRKKNKEKAWLLSLRAKYDCAISAVTLFELRCGASSAQKQEDIDTLLRWISVIDFDSKVADQAARIYLALRSENRLIEFRDIFIGATALHVGADLATLNRNHFERLPDLRLLSE